MTGSPYPILAIDTSGPFLQVGVMADANSFAIESIDLPKGHAEHLFAHLENCLGEVNLRLQDIARIAVTLGPGSFTGLRVGISAARGLGLALNVPVLGIPNLQALSLVQDSDAHSIIVDAKRGQMYVQDFSSAGAPISAPQMVDQDGRDMLVNPKVDLQALLTFASTCDPTQFPPDPLYIRPADAKPQTKNLIARVGADQAKTAQELQ